MSELKMISPLLDHMIVEKERFGHNGQPYYTLRNEKSKEQFILKVISLPENDSRIRALILSGAYADEKSVHEYYGRLAEDMKAELECGQKLASSGCFAGAISFQVEPKSTGVGYDIYILYPMNISLSEFLTMNAMTHLRALNLGIDLCDSILACREAGYLFQNVRPESIFLMTTGKFLLGDLGLTSLEYLQFAGVPEEYLGTYSAPELSDIAACPNLTIDLYALGMVLYRIYNGNHAPFEDESTNAAMAEKLRQSGKPLPSPIYADYELAEIILKACTFKKEDRYQTPEELKQALVLYMQRNAVSDDLIAPPIIADIEPVSADTEEMDEEPIRMTDAKDLDEDFRQSFAPDMSGAGDDAVQEEEAPQPVTVPSDDSAPVEESEEPTQEPAEEPVAEEEPLPEEPAVPADDDQMDIDSLLASVNAVIEDSAAEADAAEDIEQTPASDDQTDEPVQEPSNESPRHDYVDAERDDEEETDDAQQEAQTKRPRILLWSVIVASLAGIALLGYFLLNWYFVDITELKTVYTTPTQIMVELVTDDDPNHFIVTCADSYGNTYEALRSGKQYCFTDLRENTSYTISVAAAKNHSFSTAAPSLTETTNDYTTISDIAFTRLNKDGDVRISFKHQGPVPAQWQLTYYKRGESTISVSEPFDGESYDIEGLELYATYVFTIEDVGGVFIAGENTAEYQVYPHINASDFTIDDITDQVVSLSWTQADLAPDKWFVTCSAEGMDDINLNTTETSAQITLPDFEKSYTFYLTAKGMDEPQKIVLDAAPIIVNNLTAQSNDSGELVVTWDTPAGEPEGGWLLSYRLKNCYYADTPVVNCPSEDENSVTLKYLPADSQFEIMLIALDTEANPSPRVFGTTTVEGSTASAKPFTGYQILPATPYGDGTGYESLIALWEEPAKDKWDYRDLNTPRRTTYSTDESIGFCVQIDSCDLSTAVKDDLVYLTYAVRDASGQIVAFEIIRFMDEQKTKPLVWEGVWYDRRHTGTIPTPYSPTEADANGKPVVLTGKFTFELYINGKLLATKGFTIEA